MTIQENISQAACRLLHVASDGLRGNSCEPGNFRCIVATLGLWWVIQGWRGCLNVFLEKKIISNHRFQNLRKQKYHLSGALKLLWYSFQTAHTGFFKKNSHRTWQASKVHRPPPTPTSKLQLNRVNIPNMNGCFFWRPMTTTRRKQLWSWGQGGITRLNLHFYRMAVFYEEPGMGCFLVQHLVQRVCSRCVDGPVIL